MPPCYTVTVPHARIFAGVRANRRIARDRNLDPTGALKEIMEAGMRCI